MRRHIEAMRRALGQWGVDSGILSPVERDVASFMAEGQTNVEIARRLKIAERKVRSLIALIHAERAFHAGKGLGSLLARPGGQHRG